MFYIFTFIVLILFVVIVAVLEYKNTQLEEEIEMLTLEPCTEWKTFAQEKPEQYEYIIIRKKLTEVEIQYWGIYNEGLQHEIFVGFFDDNDIFHGGTDNTTIINNYNISFQFFFSYKFNNSICFLLKHPAVCWN